MIWRRGWSVVAGQITDDFKTPPLTASWIPMSNVVFPIIQKIMIGDIDAKAGMDQAATAAAKVIAGS